MTETARELSEIGVFWGWYLPTHVVHHMTCNMQSIFLVPCDTVSTRWDNHYAQIPDNVTHINPIAGFPKFCSGRAEKAVVIHRKGQMEEVGGVSSHAHICPSMRRNTHVPTYPHPSFLKNSVKSFKATTAEHPVPGARAVPLTNHSTCCSGRGPSSSSAQNYQWLRPAPFPRGARCSPLTLHIHAHTDWHQHVHAHVYAHRSKMLIS